MHRQKCAPVRVVASGGVRQEGNTRCRTRIGQLSRWHTKCAPKEEVRPGATIKVTEGGGADSGGTDSGGTTTGGTGSGGTTSGGGDGGSTGGGGGETDFPGKDVSVAYECKTPIGDNNATSPVRIDTSAQPGGASGGSGSGGAAGSDGAAASGGGTDSGGGLAATGAEDGGALRALGLVAGTAILLGGAVFTFTPWRKLRGTR